MSFTCPDCKHTSHNPMDELQGYCGACHKFFIPSWPPSNTLEVGTHGGEVIVNHPDLKPDEWGVGHIVFSPQQARNFANLLLKHADIAEKEIVR